MSGHAYYNENDPFAAQWLRNLIREGLIADGEVDERSIVDVRPDDVRGFSQAHWFAGIGGWHRALRLAGWADHSPVWTGSCPCQPFSAAGKRKGFADARHLWPEWFRLIKECRPSIIFGEQVARATKWLWHDAVATDLENEGYAFGAAVLPAASVGAPHRRDRLWFVAHSDRSEQTAGRRNDGKVPRHTEGESQPEHRADLSSRSSQAMAYANGARLPERHQSFVLGQQPTIVGSGWWSAEPDVGRVAYGIPGRVGRLRAYGNAIVPQVAAEFIIAAGEAINLRARASGVPVGEGE